MTHNQMIRVLRSNKVTVNYRTWKVIESLANCKEKEVISIELGTPFYNKYIDDYPIDLSSTLTYGLEERNKFVFYYEDKLMCDIISREGGYFDHVKFKATVALPDSFLDVISHYIESTLHGIAEDAYDDYEQKRRHEWMENFKINYLNS